jgi:hypothetical protein
LRAGAAVAVLLHALVQLAVELVGLAVDVFTHVRHARGLKTLGRFVDQVDAVSERAGLRPRLPWLTGLPVRTGAGLMRTLRSLGAVRALGAGARLELRSRAGLVLRARSWLRRAGHVRPRARRGRTDDDPRAAEPR